MIFACVPFLQKRFKIILRPVPSYFIVSNMLANWSVRKCHHNIHLHVVRFDMHFSFITYNTFPGHLCSSWFLFLLFFCCNFVLFDELLSSFLCCMFYFYLFVFVMFVLPNVAYYSGLHHPFSNALIYYAFFNLHSFDKIVFIIIIIMQFHFYYQQNEDLWHTIKEEQYTRETNMTSLTRNCIQSNLYS